MNNLNSIDIKKLKQDGKIIPFVGAGLSKQLDLPTGDQLIEIIAEDLKGLKWDPQILRISGELSQIAEYYEIVKGGIGSLRSLLDRAFYRTDDEIMKSRSHMALAKCNFPIIYTTNYDNLIEKSMELNGNTPAVIKNLRDLFMPDLSNTKNHVIKFHGTFHDDEGLVLTEKSYFERLEFESALDIKLRADSLGKTLLFLGYSFKDINMRYLIYKLKILRDKQKSSIPDGLPIAILVDYSPNEIVREICKSRGVEIVELDSANKNESMVNFLESLQ